MDIFILSGCLVPGLYIAYTDIKDRIVYDIITLPMLAAGAVYSIYNQVWQSAFISAGLVFMVLLTIALLIPAGIGGGDIKLTTGLGMWFGPQILYVLLMGTILALLWEAYRCIKKGVFLQVFCKRIIVFLNNFLAFRTVSRPNIKSKSETIPYAVFLILAAWIMCFSNLLY